MIADRDHRSRPEQTRRYSGDQHKGIWRAARRKRQTTAEPWPHATTEPSPHLTEATSRQLPARGSPCRLPHRQYNAIIVGIKRAAPAESCCIPPPAASLDHESHASMTHRQRVAQSIRHQQPDRPPKGEIMIDPDFLAVPSRHCPNAMPPPCAWSSGLIWTSSLKTCCGRRRNRSARRRVDCRSYRIVGVCVMNTRRTGCTTLTTWCRNRPRRMRFIFRMPQSTRPRT